MIPTGLSIFSIECPSCLRRCTAVSQRTSSYGSACRWPRFTTSSTRCFFRLQTLLQRKIVLLISLCLKTSTRRSTLLLLKITFSVRTLPPRSIDLANPQQGTNIAKYCTSWKNNHEHCASDPQALADVRYDIHSSAAQAEDELQRETRRPYGAKHVGQPSTPQRTQGSYRLCL